MSYSNVKHSRDIKKIIYNNNGLWIWAALITLAILTSTATLCRELRKDSGWGNCTRGVQCKVVADKEKYHLGENPRVEVAFRNCSSKRIGFLRDHLYTVTIHRNEIIHSQSNGMNSECLEEGHILLLGPGDTIVYLINTADVLTKQRGRYEYEYSAELFAPSGNGTVSINAPPLYIKVGR